MIPKPIDNILETNSDGKKIKFRFEANAHVFRTFSDDLYSNKPDSVVREIISNAKDSNDRVGSKKPLVIILNNEFIVEDSGTGISEEVMENVFSVYGNSDKRNTNNELGKFGLGCKSPFAISDLFVVETKPGDGFKYVYMIYKDLSGSGEINLTSCIQTDEPLGTKIRIPIKGSLYSSIRIAILKYTNFLTPYPITHFANNFVSAPAPIISQNDHYVEYKEGSIGSGFNILYDEWMPYSVPSLKIPNGILLKVEKENLELSASRESVTKSEELTELLNEKLLNYWNTIEKACSEKVSLSDDPVEIIDLLRSCYDKYTGFFMKETKIHVDNHPKYGKIEYPFDNNHCNLLGFIRSKRYEELGYNDITTGTYVTYLKDEDWDKIKSPYYKQKINQIIRKDNKKLVLVLTESNIANTTNSLAEALFKNAVNLKDYKIYRTNTTSGRKYDKTVISADVRHNDRTEYWDKKDVKLADGEYIYTVRKEVFPRDLPSEKGVKYCVIQSRSVNKVSKLPNWYLPQEYVKKKISDVTQEEINKIAIDRHVKYLPSYLVKLQNDNILHIKNHDKKFVEDYDKNKIQFVIKAIDYQIVKPDGSAQEILKEINEKYPLLQCLDNHKMTYYSERYMGMVASYIKLIDGRK